MTKLEEKEIVLKCIDDFASYLTTFRSLIPCIITSNDEDVELMKKSYKTIGQMLKFIDDCDGDLGYLSEEFDIQAIITEYPKIKKLFNESSRTDIGEEGDLQFL